MKLLSCLGLVCLLTLSGCPKEPTGTADGGTPDASVDGGGGDGGAGCLADSECDPQICVAGACQDPCVDDTTCATTESCNLLTGRCDPLPPICTAAEVRCALDGTQTVETCAADELSWERAPCDPQTPICLDSACVACAPGATSCNGEVAQTCLPDGSGTTDVDCAATGGTCSGGVCLACTPYVTECVDGSTQQVCNSTGTAWVPTVCTNGFCDPTVGECVITSCNPDTLSCQGDNLVLCNSTGDGFTIQEACAASGATCILDQCVDLCQAAASINNYIGCEYWPTIISSSGMDPEFQAEYAVVVSNPNIGTTAQVSVFEAGNLTPVATATVAGGQLATLYLPWNGLDAYDNTTGTSRTLSGAIAYQLISSVPVTAYQFNPLSNHIRGNLYSYSNDASLLLPTHVFGDPADTPASRYLAMAAPHIQMEIPDFPRPPFTIDLPAVVSIVATQPGTTAVTVRLSGAIAAGGGLPESDPGDTVVFDLQQFEVMQLASRAFGTEVRSTNPLSGRDHLNFPQSDLSGSLIESTQPVAVYGGADCHFVPFDQQACDHLEQQLFPFANWGSTYLGGRSNYLNNPMGDVWRILAAADGTTLSFEPSTVAPAQTLNAGEVFEFATAEDFLVTSQDQDHPVMVAQFFPGIEVTGGDPNRKQNTGDPTMILAIPVQQFKDSYSFITPTTFVEDYINVVRTAGTTVLLDGIPVSPPNGWVPVGSTAYQVGRIPVLDGTHRLDASSTVGLTVYGFDWSVSYGYPGGLDLKNIVVITPGG
ncbi:MAG: IgGFc-binding protein [Deltaproteobacteria bacterium]|nr:IgGFc-binding protein [Deltaproteobacteria bacterium]